MLKKIPYNDLVDRMPASSYKQPVVKVANDNVVENSRQPASPPEGNTSPPRSTLRSATPPSQVRLPTPSTPRSSGQDTPRRRISFAPTRRILTTSRELGGSINEGENRSPDLEDTGTRGTTEEMIKTRPRRNAARPNRFEGFETDWKDQA